LETPQNEILEVIFECFKSNGCFFGKRFFGKYNTYDHGKCRYSKAMEDNLNQQIQKVSKISSEFFKYVFIW